MLARGLFVSEWKGLRWGYISGTTLPVYSIKPLIYSAFRIGKNVLMYCTGGVRCERASALLKSKYGDNVGEVYQLQVIILFL